MVCGLHQRNGMFVCVAFVNIINIFCSGLLTTVDNIVIL